MQHLKKSKNEIPISKLYVFVHSFLVFIFAIAIFILTIGEYVQPIYENYFSNNDSKNSSSYNKPEEFKERLLKLSCGVEVHDHISKHTPLLPITRAICFFYAGIAIASLLFGKVFAGNISILQTLTTANFIGIFTGYFICELQIGTLMKLQKCKESLEEIAKTLQPDNQSFSIIATAIPLKLVCGIFELILCFLFFAVFSLKIGNNFKSKNRNNDSIVAAASMQRNIDGINSHHANLSPFQQLNSVLPTLA